MTAAIRLHPPGPRRLGPRRAASEVSRHAAREVAR
jgi:hypothetical protein